MQCNTSHPTNHFKLPAFSSFFLCQLSSLCFIAMNTVQAYFWRALFWTLQNLSMTSRNLGPFYSFLDLCCSSRAWLTGEALHIFFESSNFFFLLSKLLSSFCNFQSTLLSWHITYIFNLQFLLSFPQNTQKMCFFAFLDAFNWFPGKKSMISLAIFTKLYLSVVDTIFLTLYHL